jgi:hypothetical protein
MFVDPSELFFYSSCCRVCLAKLEKSDMVAQLTSFQQIYESCEWEHYYPMAFAQLIIYQHNLKKKSSKGYPTTIHLQDF